MRHVLVIAFLALLVAASPVGIRLRDPGTTVYFISWLDERVHVKVGEHEFDLDKDVPGWHPLPAGVHRVEITFADGDHRLIEDEPIDVPDGDGVRCAIYNVAGAALLFRARAAYGSGATLQVAAEADPNYQPIAGARFYTDNETEYVFKRPPDTLKMPTRFGVVYWISTARAHDWVHTISTLADFGQHAKALELVERLARLYPTHETNRQRLDRAMRLAKLSKAD